MQIWINDIEVYPNIFTSVFKNTQTKEVKTFILFNDKSPKDYGIKELIEFLDDKDKTIVGFNSVEYDNIILKSIINHPNLKNSEIKELNDDIILSNLNLWEHTNIIIKDAYNTPDTWGRTIDLKIIQGFVGRISLKKLEYRLGFEKMQDLPYHFNQHLTSQEAQQLIKYNINDVEVTEYLFNLKSTQDIIAAREALEEQFNLNPCTHLKDAKLAENILIDEYCSKNFTVKNKIKNEIKDKQLYNFKNYIHSNVKFQSNKYNDILTDISSITFDIKNDKITDKFQEKNLRDVLIDNLIYTFGEGGLHASYAYPKAYYKSNDEHVILHLDVTSMYPYIIINNNIYPKQLNESFIDIFKDIVEKRIAYKKAGDKVKANSLKIVINSVFGKLSDVHSPLRDKESHFRVVLNGQLYILMYVEELILNNFEVLEVNTDGLFVYIKRDRIEELKNCVAKISQLTMLNMEMEEYNHFLKVANNNYLAIDIHGEIEDKGATCNITSLKTTSDMRIIPMTAIEYMKGNTDYRKFITEHTDYKNFTGYVEGDKNSHGIIDDKGTLYDRRIRVYKSNTNSVNLFGRKEDGSKGKKINDYVGDNVTVLPILSDIKDINYEYYIKEFEDNFLSIILNSNVQKAYDWNQDVDNLINVGLYPFPKNYKKNPRGYKLNVFEEGYPYNHFPTLGLLTGSKFNTLCIDIDNPKLFKTSSLYALVQKIKTMYVYTHSSTRKKDAEIDEITKGKVRGKLIFITNDDSFGSDHSMLETEGFEILYGGNAIAIAGAKTETSNEKYKYFNEPILLPDFLLNYFKTKCKKQSSIVESPSIELTDDLIDINLKAVRSIINSHDKIFDREPNLDKWKHSIVVSIDEKFHDIDECFIGYNVDDFKIAKLYFNNDGILQYHTFHDSRKEDVNFLNIKLKEVVKPLIKKYKLNKANEKITEKVKIDYEFPQIIDAINDTSSNYKFVKAPTGLGKTYTLQKLAVDAVQEGKYFIIVVKDKASLAELEDGIKLLNNSNKIFRMEEGCEDIHDEIGIITHHHYFKRKGDSPFVYSIFNFIKENKPYIYFDEADEYLNKLTKIINYSNENRYRKSGGSFIHINKCPKFSNSGNCTNCHKILHSNKYNDKDYNWLFGYIGELNTSSQPYHDASNIDIDLVSETYTVDREINVTNKNFSVKLIKPKLSDKDIKFKTEADDNDDINITDTIIDLIRYSYGACIYNFHPLAKKYNSENNYEIVKENDIIKLFNKWDAEKKLPDEKKTIDVKFPSMNCYCPVLVFQDRLPLLLLKQYCKQITFLSATINEDNYDFLTSVFDELKLNKVSSNRQVLSNVHVISYAETFDNIIEDKFNNDLLNILQQTNVLRFYPTANYLEEEMKKVDSHGVDGYYSIQYYKGRTRKLQSINNLSHPNIDRMELSYSTGSISRAINLPKFGVVIVRANTYLPMIALNLKEFTEEEILIKLQRNRYNTIIQNAGRILRVSNVYPRQEKLIIIENLEEEGELNKIIDMGEWNQLAVNITNNQYLNNYNSFVTDINEFIFSGITSKKDDRTKDDIEYEFVKKQVDDMIESGKTNMSILKELYYSDGNKIPLPKANSLFRHYIIEQTTEKSNDEFIFMCSKEKDSSKIYKKYNLSRPKNEHLLKIWKEYYKKS